MRDKLFKLIFILLSISVIILTAVQRNDAAVSYRISLKYCISYNSNLFNMFFLYNCFRFSNNFDFYKKKLYLI